MPQERIAAQALRDRLLALPRIEVSGSTTPDTFAALLTL